MFHFVSYLFFIILYPPPSLPCYDIVRRRFFRDFGNYEDGDGNEVPSSFKSTDYGIQVGYSPTENQRIQLGFRQSFGRDVLHAGLPMDTEIDDSNVLSVDYKLDTISDGLKALSAKVYRSNVDHVMTNELRPSFMMTEAVSEVGALTVGGRVELEWRPIQDLKLYTGLDAFSVGRTAGRRIYPYNQTSR